MRAGARCELVGPILFLEDGKVVFETTVMSRERLSDL